MHSPNSASDVAYVDPTNSGCERGDYDSTAVLHALGSIMRGSVVLLGPALRTEDTQRQVDSPVDGRTDRPRDAVPAN
jgi:hypothetical protein